MPPAADLCYVVRMMQDRLEINSWGYGMDISHPLSVCLLGVFKLCRRNPHFINIYFTVSYTLSGDWIINKMWVKYD